MGILSRGKREARERGTAPTPPVLVQVPVVPKPQVIALERDSFSVAVIELVAKVNASHDAKLTRRFTVGKEVRPYQSYRGR